MRRIVMAVGGTGGHLVPACKLAEELSQIEVTFIGVGLDDNPYFSRKWPWITVSGDALRKVTSFGKILRGVWQSVRALRKIKPALIVGFGSYHSFPVLVAARLMGTPYMLYEANASYGKVNRLFAPRACGVGALLNDLPFATRVSGPDASFSGRGSEPTVLVFGGSQGAETINQTFLTIAAQLDVSIIHLVGKHGNVEEISRFYQRHHIKVCVKAFEENMHMAYNRANLAICRAGAGTVAELIAHRLPAVLIPYPYASEGHQLANARLMESMGGALVLEEGELTAESLLAAIARGLADEKQMKEALEGHQGGEVVTSFREMILTQLGET